MAAPDAPAEQVGPAGRLGRNGRLLRAGFYVVVGLVLLALVTKAQTAVLPAGPARQLGHNSEAFCFALLVVALLQLRPRRPARAQAAALAVGGLLLVVLGVLLQHSALPPTLVTLNEPLVGAGLVALYLAVPRPLPAPWVAPAVSLVVLVLVVAFFDTDVVLDQAESLVPFLLAPIALDVVEVAAVQGAPDRPRTRLGWMALLVLLALAVMVGAAQIDRDDLVGVGPHALDYAQRAAEAYWGWLVVHAYLGLQQLLARTDTRTSTGPDTRTPRDAGRPTRTTGAPPAPPAPQE